MGLIKLIKNRISREWKDAFNNNVDYLNGLEESLKQSDTYLGARIDNLVLNSGGNSPTEVVDARINNKAESFTTLQERLVNHENSSDNEIVDIKDKLQKQKELVDQINKAVQQFLGGYNEDITLYVSKDGNDQTGDGSEENPFLTIQTAINSLPILTTKGISLIIEDGVYLEDITITGFTFRSFVIRPKNSFENINPLTSDLPVKIRSLGIYACSGYITLRGIQFVDPANSPVFEGRQYGAMIDQSGYLALNRCKFAERTLGMQYNAVYSGGTSKMNMYGNTTFINQEMAVRVRLMAEGTFSARGSGNNIAMCVDNATGRGSVPGGFATTNYQTIAYGLIVTKGTVLS